MPPATITLPATMRAAQKLPAEPATNISPRRSLSAQRDPTSPSTTTRPPRMPAASHGGAAPRWSPASPAMCSSPPAMPEAANRSTEPRTTRRPPRMSRPRKSPPSPMSSQVPAAIAAPSSLNRRSPPSNTRCSSGLPPTRNRSPSARLSRPQRSGSLSMAASDSAARRSGVIPASDTRPGGGWRSVSVRLMIRPASLPGPRGGSADDASWVFLQKLAQVKMKRAELAAIVTGGDSPHAGHGAGGPDADGGGPRDLLHGQAVDDDLQHAVLALGQFARHAAAQGRAVGIVGRCRQGLVFRTDLGARAHHAAGEGHDHAFDAAHRGDRRLGGGQGRIGRFGEDQEVAAADGLDHGRALLAEKLTVHDRYAPVTTAADQLGDLVTVAEIAQRLAERQRLAAADAGECGRRGTGQDALADAPLELLGQLLGRHREQQQGDAGTAVRRFLGRQFALDSSLAAAGDHRGGEAGGAVAGVARPGGIARGDDDPGRLHAEGFGEAVVDQHAGDAHQGLPQEWTTSDPPWLQASQSSSSPIGKPARRIVMWLSK